MKFIDVLIKKFGYNNIFHYLVGFGITGISFNYGLITTVIAILLVVIFSFMKEDENKPEDIEILSYSFGVITAFVLYIPKILFPFL